IPRVAIVGRPNAGKSSLMNMIAGRKVSIVDPTPGVTRDRVTTIAELPSPDGKGPIKLAEFVDTGGYGVYVAEGGRFDEIGHDLTKLTGSIEEQIARAVQDADLVLFAIDTQAGLTPPDMEIARLLRERRYGDRKTVKEKKAAKEAALKAAKEAAKKAAKKTAKKTSKKTSKKASAEPPPEPPAEETQLGPEIRVVATKVDGPKWETHALEFSGLGFGEPLMCSAKNNYMRRDFIDRVYAMLPKPPKREERPTADMMLAIIGKRNAGKSTLVNTLAGEPRVIVSEIPGTTRDAVDVRFEMDGRSLVAIDTAGLRRKRSFQGPIEWYAFDRARLAIDRADIVLMMIDATEKISQVDEQLAMLCQKRHKPVVIVVNKWDLVEGQRNQDGKLITTDDYEKYVRAELKGLHYAPIAFTEGASGRNVRETVSLAFELFEQARTRVTTGVLNRLIREIVKKHAPSDKLGSHAKVYFAAQTRTMPPTITLVVNKPEMFVNAYQRYILNRIRETLPFAEVPIRLVIRGRRRDEAKAGLGETEIGALGSLDESTLLGSLEDEAQKFADEEAAELANLGEGELDEAPDADDDDDAEAYFED
ncbi:MAG: ribosome biogenesis GTPase Der, partial [Planctomycetota bacterium]|nr:ribosome biogenesis GTPase Der [Planctomycetota bacterium]